MVQPAVVREPLKFKAILQSRIWGGDGLHRLLAKGRASDKDIGESWELSDRDDNASVIASGTFAGKNLRELFSIHARDILGSQYSPTLARFPLLYKFIFARENLSVQVHPGDGSALGESKTECWYVLDAPAGAELILGIAGGGSREEVLAALRTKECRTVLNKVPVRAGDMFFIPAGTVHAITAGLLLYEVQQNSDTTFRLYDWDRLDPAGKPRQLHLDESAQVLDLRRHDKHRIPPLVIRRPTHEEEFRVACRHFAVARLSKCKGAVPLANRERFRVLTCIKGSFEMGWDGGQAMPIALGETVLVPAACVNPKLRETGPDSEVLVSYLPVLGEEIYAPLKAAGYGDQEIRDLGGLEGLP
ncbi:MAG TPA: type I phosphomannose isomerase catalytic subunit [Fibrobacteria bacterium]|nr:type I phosphomannose isomerase catalytic subunit [Fibrobacteria bacterium]